MLPQKPTCEADDVMLQRMFLQDEKSSFQLEKKKVLAGVY